MYISVKNSLVLLIWKQVVWQIKSLSWRHSLSKRLQEPSSLIFVLFSLPFVLGNYIKVNIFPERQLNIDRGENYAYFRFPLYRSCYYRTHQCEIGAAEKPWEDSQLIAKQRDCWKRGLLGASEEVVELKSVPTRVVRCVGGGWGEGGVQRKKKSSMGK